jgi:hypothetical protein
MYYRSVCSPNTPGKTFGRSCLRHVAKREASENGWSGRLLYRFFRNTDSDLPIERRFFIFYAFRDDRFGRRYAQQIRAKRRLTETPTS